MKTKNIIGWVLLSIGLIIIAWTLFFSVRIFTGKASPPQVFKVTVDSTQQEVSGDKKTTITEDLQNQLRKMVDSQLSKILPFEFFDKVMNLLAWSLLAIILFFGGGKLCTIGVAMLKL